MWLPTPVYRALPVAYAGAGCALVAGAVNLGIDAPTTPLYLASGAFCLLMAAAVSAMRARSRRRSTDDPGVADGDGTAHDEPAPLHR